MILARDFGEKNPSYPRSFKAGRKRVKYCSVSTSWNWAQTPQAKEVKETRPCACSGLQSEKLLSAQSMALPRLMACWEVVCIPAFPGIPPKGKVTGVFWIAVDYTWYFWPWNMDTQLVLGRPGICYRAGDHGVPKGTLSPKGGASCFLFLMENAVIFTYLKTNDICITVDDFFHDSLFPVLPIECPRWAVAIELPGGVFITQHIVTHNCKWSCKDRDKGKGYQPLGDCLFDLGKSGWKSYGKAQHGKEMPSIPFKWQKMVFTAQPYVNFSSANEHKLLFSLWSKKMKPKTSFPVCHLVNTGKRTTDLPEGRIWSRSFKVIHGLGGSCSGWTTKKLNQWLIQGFCL